MVYLEVDDNGPGIAPEQRSNVFEPFHTTKESGLGLGLSISRTIAGMAGGRISVADSDLGGAKFCVVLPVAINDSQRASEDPASQPSNLR
jgi:two-component system C4-dicarboxylate transport sensor histidine kinase DctB